jgi:hypothetical protein
VALVLLGAAMAGLPARAETITVSVDQASVVKLPGQVATIIVGNPLIADASLQRGGILVVTGKGYGSTNLLALDRNGSVVMDKSVQVLGAASKDLVTVYRGAERESLSCAPDCAPRIMLGDSIAYFNGVLAQSGARNTAAAAR